MEMPTPPEIPHSAHESRSGVTAVNRTPHDRRFNDTSFSQHRNGPPPSGHGWESNRSNSRRVNYRKEMFYEGLYVDGLLRKKRKIENSQVRAIEAEE